MNNEIAKINQSAFELVLEDEMNEKTMTMQEIADAMGVSKDTIRNCVRRVFPDKMKQGKTAYFNEAEVAVISKELKSNAYVSEQLTSEAASQVKNTTTELEVIANYKQATEALITMLNAKNEELKKQLIEQQPKVDTYNRIANSKGLKTMQEVAAELNIGTNTLFATLRGLGILWRDRHGTNLPKREYIERGYFEVKEEPYKKNGKDIVYSRIYTTAKGLLWLEKQIVA